jgi:hypothetical protein
MMRSSRIAESYYMKMMRRSTMLGMGHEDDRHQAVDFSCAAR